MVDDQLSVIGLPGLESLFDVLRERGHRLIGPVRRDDAVDYAEISGLADLPRGVHDDQSPGHYRLLDGEDGALFGYAAAATSAKPQLFPPRLLLWAGERDEGGFTVRTPDQEPPLLALIGVRSCDLRAIAVHDRVLAGRGVVDPDYLARRRRIFVVAVACGRPSGTCFCTSTGGGPHPDAGYDLCLTELEPAGPGEHRFVVEVGSPVGAHVIAELADRAPVRAADDVDRTAVTRQAEAAVAAIGRWLDTDGLRDLLYDNVEHPRWDDVAQRCLACGNCTLVCPTCFCTTIEDETDLTDTKAARHRVWDSCFTEEFGYLHGGSVRSSVASRYRQWATHKLAAWTDQFGMLGCVGCGRCITWCPVGIDLTEEVAAIRARPRSATVNPSIVNPGAGQGAGATSREP
jgi:ferredoxin